MHYRTVDLKQPERCVHCEQEIPTGATALRLQDPGTGRFVGYTHLNDCLRHPPLLRRPGRK
jgi:hypothetical protein